MTAAIFRTKFSVIPHPSIGKFKYDFNAFLKDWSYSWGKAKMNEITLSIKEKLTQIEQRENIRILYACESGSRAWQPATCA